MVKLRVSYETEEEVCKVLMLLGRAAKKIKKPPERKGKYWRAYIDLIDLENAEIKRDDG